MEETGFTPDKFYREVVRDKKRSPYALMGNVAVSNLGVLSMTTFLASIPELTPHGKA